MADTVYLQIDECTAARFAQTLASAVEGAITEAARSLACPPDRDQLAAMAMQGLVSDPNVPMQSSLQIAAVARLAHQMADAMLAERSRA